MNINFREKFDYIKQNLDDDIYITNTINLISNNYYTLNYDLFIEDLIMTLDDTNFVIMFINKLFDKLYQKTKIILQNMIKSILKKNNCINKLQNLFLLDCIDDTILFDIYKFNNKNDDNYLLLLEWIYEIGKIDIINKLMDNLIINLDNITYYVMFDIIISLIKFHKKLINTDFYVSYSKKLIIIMKIVISLFELTEIIRDILMFNQNDDIFFNEKIIIIFDFYKNILQNRDIYFDIIIYEQIIKLLNFLVKINSNINNNYEIIDELIKLIYSSSLNIHEKTQLFIDISNFLLNDKINYIPSNFIKLINYYISNIKFISWSNIDEKIIILENISKLLLEIKKKNELYFDDFDNMIYNILYLETEIFNMIKIILQTNILYTNYNLIKNTIYTFITILNIFNDILYIYFNLCKENNIYYGDLLHKNNLIINIYVNFFNNKDNISFITKYNTHILFRSIMINKFMIVVDHIDYEKFPIYGLEFDMIINYYQNINVNILLNFIDKINIIKDKCIKSNEFIEKYNNINDNIYIDNIFSIEIQDPIMIPKSEIFYEKSTMYLLLRETHKNPYTREDLNLNDVIEYNKNEDIKRKINEYLLEKKQK